MAKLIRSVKDCGNRQSLKTKLHVKIGHICLLTQRYCDPQDEHNFPKTCPLEEGILKPDHVHTDPCLNCDKSVLGKCTSCCHEDYPNG
jgi:hypothetical protein